EIFGKAYQLKPHQQQAIRNWRNNNFRGIFELCTGAGKTFTAIHSLVSIYNSSSTRRLFAVICVPYVNLAEQWIENLALYNIFPVQCFDSNDKWFTRLNELVS